CPAEAVRRRHQRWVAVAPTPAPTMRATSVQTIGSALDPGGLALGCVATLRPVAGCAVVLGQPAGDHVPHALADVHGVVADALVEAGHHGQLHGDLEVD